MPAAVADAELRHDAGSKRSLQSPAGFGASRRCHDLQRKVPHIATAGIGRRRIAVVDEHRGSQMLVNAVKAQIAVARAEPRDVAVRLRWRRRPRGLGRVGVSDRLATANTDRDRNSYRCSQQNP